MQSHTGQSKLLSSGEMRSHQPLRDGVWQGNQDWDSLQDWARRCIHSSPPPTWAVTEPGCHLRILQIARSRQHYQLIRVGTQPVCHLWIISASLRVWGPQGVLLSGRVRRRKLPFGHGYPVGSWCLPPDLPWNPTCSPAVSVLDTTETFQNSGLEQCQATVTWVPGCHRK